jgi:5-formyltetrahydrofolate cyclo-ligase
MNNKDVASEKAVLRNSLKAARASREYDPEFATRLNVHLAELCIANGVTKVACYLPFGDEPDVELFLDWALDNDLEVLLPVANADQTLTWVVFDGTTQVGILGFNEPAGSEVDPKDVGLVIVPAMAVSTSGIRLGKGKGFYDRALPAFTPIPPIAAVTFDDEILEHIPHEPHDHPIDAVVTPAGITHFTERLK